MEVLSLCWSGKYGHFLRAEANASALTYPFPPRTAVLGMLAAILGLEKDSLAHTLGDAKIALTFEHGLPLRFSHRVKLRKDPPAALSWEIKKNQQTNKQTAPEKATLNLQEWLWQPDFLVHVALPEKNVVFEELHERVKNRRWHFNPCMGLSELLASVEFVACSQAMPLNAGEHQIAGLCPADSVDKLTNQRDGLGVHLLRLPWQVDDERVFQHQAYYLEHQGREFAAHTAQAWRLGGHLEALKVVFS